jgi:arginase family enzyme
MNVYAIDLDGSIVGQPFMQKLLADRAARVIAATDLAPRLRIVASRAARADLEKRIAAAMDPHMHGARSSSRSSHPVPIVFYGSGDFHHITVCLIERHVEPLSVVQIDNHPDWVTFPATLNCGSWVNHALKLPRVAQVVTLGPTGKDLEWPELKAGNLRAVVEGRLKIVPWRKTRSRVFGRYGDSACWRQRGRWLEWFDASTASRAEMLAQLVRDIPTNHVYVTIDKDALVATEATTNWDQGCMRLEDIESLVAMLAREKRLVGIDVCGDHSPPQFRDLFRRTLSYFDRARTEPTVQELAVNASTNARLLDRLAALTTEFRA